MERNKWHVVGDDEDLVSIAAAYGFGDWKPLEDDPKNKPLWEKGRTPFTLHMGDKVWVPPITPKVFECETNRTHKLVWPRPKMVFHTVLQTAEGGAQGGLRYELWVGGRRSVPKGGDEIVRTRRDGVIHQLVPLAGQVELRVWFPPGEHQEYEGAPDPDDAHAKSAEADEPPADQEDRAWEKDPDGYERFVINMGHLDPLSTVEGVQDRLNNLGYPCGEDHGKVGEPTKKALRAFQLDYGLYETGAIDDATRARIGEVFDGEKPKAPASQGGTRS